MLTAFSQRELVERARDAGVMAYLVKPFGRADLVPAIELAVARHEQLVQLEREVEGLEDRLATRTLVDQAKAVLQSSFGLTEPAAFRWIQKTSMDRRMSMREVARSVVEARSPVVNRSTFRSQRQDRRTAAELLGIKPARLGRVPFGLRSEWSGTGSMANSPTGGGMAW